MSNLEKQVISTIETGFALYQSRALETAFPYKEAINRIDKNAKAPNLRKLLQLCYTGVGLGEAGEIQGKIKKIIRDSEGVITSGRKEALKKELGDLLWYIATTAHELDLNLGDVAVANIENLKGRSERGTLQGDGDDR